MDISAKTPKISKDKQAFTHHLINDLNSLEQMLAKDLFEKGTTRIGAEQEYCLIDYSLRPAMKAMEVLGQIDDPHFTTELAKFNMEANLDPLHFSNSCFSAMETDLVEILTKANKIAHSNESKIILTGILPTIRKSDIAMEHITPIPRYKALNDAILEARQDDFKFHIIGLDELIARHDNVLFESCNTSFQIHYQVDAPSAVKYYNWAHAISGPVLAAACNSPMFMGKRLWRETRIALFHQSTDTRKSFHPLRKERSRVTFGQDWEYGSVLNIFQDVVGRYKILLPVQIPENSQEVLKAGKIPKLKALAVHNGTIYRWNRMCYGITEGKPHLRIENRYIPSGPTIVDEVANAAFWTGLMNGLPKRYENIHEQLDFDCVKQNFLTAAKAGLQAQFTWIDGKLIPAQDLILEELLPIAHEGLQKANVSNQDIEKYLTIIEQRVKSGQTGAQWMLNSFNKLKSDTSSEEALVGLTEGIYKRQKLGSPVHTWTEIEPDEGGGWQNKYRFVEQVMVKDLITIHEDDLVELARNMMLWSNVHHLPVENDHGELVGLITSDQLLNILGKSDNDLSSLTVGDVMQKEVITVTPQTKTIDAYYLMKTHEIGSLPVVSDSKLIGIITINDYVKLMGYFFTEMKNGQIKKG